jgi:hypothetical protein
VTGVQTCALPICTNAVWAAGELLEFGGDFNNFIIGKQLQKQEGIIFRHLLRLILLIGEFTQLTPPDLDPQQWREELQEIADRLTAACRKVDPTSTDKANTYMLFKARMKGLLNGVGLGGYIVPNSWLTIESASSIRRLLLPARRRGRGQDPFPDGLRDPLLRSLRPLPLRQRRKHPVVPTAVQRQSPSDNCGSFHDVFVCIIFNKFLLSGIL